MTFRDCINSRCERKLSGERQHKLNVRYKEYVARKLNKPPRKVPSEWDWELLGQTGVIKAFTRSEARAQLKERLNLKRVPKEVILVARTK
jgi:hypothetical protein